MAHIIKRGQAAVDVPLEITNSNTAIEDASDSLYVIKSAKLIKFRDTKLQAIRFT